MSDTHANSTTHPPVTKDIDGNAGDLKVDSVEMVSESSTESVILAAADTMVETYTITLPVAVGTTGQVIKATDGVGNTEWADDDDIEVVWGAITGSLSSQTDLNSALASKGNIDGQAFTNGTYNGVDLSTGDGPTNFLDGEGNYNQPPNDNDQSSGIAGAVQFSEGDGAFNSDATNLFWDDTNDRLGLGEATPLARLHVTTGDTGVAAISGNRGLIVESNAGGSGMILLGAGSSELSYRFGLGEDNSGGIFYSNISDEIMQFRVGGGTKATINDAGQMFTLRAGGTQDFPTANAVYQAKGTNGIKANIVLDHQSNTNTASGGLVLRRMIDSDVLGVPPGYRLGNIPFQGWDGVDTYRTGAFIEGLVEETAVKPFDVPAGIGFFTRTSLADTPINNGFSELATAAEASISSVVTLDFASTTDFQVGDIITTTGGDLIEYNEIDVEVTSLGTGDQVIYTSANTLASTADIPPTATRTKAKIDTIVRSSNVSTATYDVAHDYENGDIVTIEGSTSASDTFNDTVEIFSSTSNSFQYANIGVDESATTDDALSFYQTETFNEERLHLGSNGDVTTIGDLVTDSDVRFEGGPHATNIFTLRFNPTQVTTIFTQFIGQFNANDGAVIIDIGDSGNAFGASSQFRVTRQFGQTPVVEALNGTNQGNGPTGRGYDIYFHAVGGSGYQLYFRLDKTGGATNVHEINFLVQTTTQSATRANTDIQTNDNNISVCDYSYYSQNSGTKRYAVGGKPPIGNSVLFQVISETQGFLPPVMTENQRDAISNPEPGLVVFTSDAPGTLNVQNNAGWEEIQTQTVANAMEERLLNTIKSLEDRIVSLEAG